MGANIFDISSTKWDRFKRVYPHDDSNQYSRPLNPADTRQIDFKLMNQGIGRGYVWFINFTSGGYERNYYITGDKEAMWRFIRAHRNDPKYWERLPTLDRGERQFKGVPFQAIRDSGAEYLQIHLAGALGMGLFTADELTTALARAERIRKKYGLV